MQKVSTESRTSSNYGWFEASEIRNAWETLKQLQNYPDTILRAVKEYEPSIIAKYALHLSNHLINTMQLKVLVKDEQLNARLALVKSVSVVLRKCPQLVRCTVPRRNVSKKH